jgi:peptide/nickel transport system substrate-binding protein
MTLKRRDVLRDAAGSLAAAPLAAPRIVRAASQTTLTFVPQADLAILDPVWTTATVTRNHGFLVFDTLFGQDETFKPVPQMAEGVSADADGKTWTIKLRPGLMFHDNTPVLGRDCVASLQRWGKRDAFGQALMAATDEISAPDDTSIRFRIKKPFPLLPDALSKFTAYLPVIMPERLAKTDAFTQVQEMVGSGPYRFVTGERMVGNQVVYEKFTDYKPREAGTPEDRQLRSCRVEDHSGLRHRRGRAAKRRDRLVGDAAERLPRPAAQEPQRRGEADRSDRQRRHPADEPACPAVRQPGDPPRGDRGG